MSFPEGDAQARSTADAVARRSIRQIVAFLATRTRDVAAAEDALSRHSLRRWRIAGERCRRTRQGWLLTVARRKVIDMHRGRTDMSFGRAVRILAAGLKAAANDPEIRISGLALMFACGHRRSMSGFVRH